MHDVVTLVWSYSPEDYFEKPVRVPHPKYDITIADGKVQARLSPQCLEEIPSIYEEADNCVRNCFFVEQLGTHAPFCLSRPSVHRLRPDGRTDVTVLVEPLELTVSLARPDIVITNVNGKVVTDTRTERTQKQRRLRCLAAKHSTDRLLRTLRASHDAAVRDPANELVHLYEIREALTTHFRGQPKARCALRVSRRQWSRLGVLANRAGLKQGRHRGEAGGRLRDATEEELREARSIARSLIEGYIQFLERGHV